MIGLIDNFLNKITMYRLMLYYLIFLSVIALILSFFKLLPFTPLSLILSPIFLVAVCYATNKIFSTVFFKAATNLESTYISALILSLIITPANSLQDFQFLFWAGVLAMASKYLFTINKKHVFNPVAIALTLTYLAMNNSASWWVGTAPMFPFVLLGLLIVKKIQRWSLVFYFFLAVSLIALGSSIYKGSDIFAVFNNLIFNSPFIFFAFVMLIEPLTTPPVRLWQSAYGAIVGIISFFVIPEIALVLGNVFSYLVSPKIKLFLSLKKKIKIAPDIYEFDFTPNQKSSFTPGQYMEWTLPHNWPDSRGVRRYFTLASSPTEEDLKLGIKFYERSSSFKKALLSMNAGAQIVASQLSGEFTLPKNPKQKLVFIAGGIGVTPFRSMIKYSLDKGEKRDIVLFYTDKTFSEIVYKDLFEKAEKELGMRIVYCLTDEKAVPENWQGRVGRVSDKMIAEEVPDYPDRIFYLSGPHAMVDAFENTLKTMGVPKNRIKTDFFPGYA